jgi:hypothetical protein
MPAAERHVLRQGNGAGIQNRQAGGEH